LPDEVDDMPLQWSGGWLFDQLALLLTDPKKFWDGPVGFGGDDPDYDPMFDADAAPPDGWERLPVYVPPVEVSDG
jgi:hypothetical protein